MRRLKAIWFIPAILLLAAFAFAQNVGDSQELAWQDFSLAGIDNTFIPFKNPSLLGTGHANGLAWVNLMDEKEFKKHYWLMINENNLSYVFEHSEDANYHLLGFGAELFPAHIMPNLYVGTNYRWQHKNIKNGSFRSAVSYRPHPFSSLAFSWDNPKGSGPLYSAGLALRPLAFISGIEDHRLELSIDMDYNSMGSKDGKYEIKKPVIGLNTQVLDGVNLSASYSMEKESAFLGFGLDFAKISAGALWRSKENDNYGYSYLHLSSDALYKPLFGINPPKWYQMPAKAELQSYRAPKYSVGPFKLYEKSKRSIEAILDELEAAKADPATDGILLVNPAFSASFALQQELLDGFRAYKESGKKIAIYYDNISNGGYIFASAIADKIYLNPNGMVDLRGLAISSPYLKDLLDSIGIEVINFRSHKYKNAANMFSESEMTEAEREVYDSLLQSLYDQMITQINSGRKEKLLKSAEETIDAGPYFLANDALDAGLVDEIIYQDELYEKLAKDFGYKKSVKKIPNYRSYAWSKPKEHLVATVYASGNIVMGKGKTGQKIAHESTIKLIRKARKNPMYKGIILRVDSGGGSAQASDIIYRELELAKNENKKAIVVSMAGAAASGGYYISANADRIFADPGTLTGSIGVVGMMFNASEMLKKIKVNFSDVKKGENADFMTLYKPMTERNKSLMEDFIEHTYEDFVNKVATGRQGLSAEDVHEIAQGRVWTGEQAFENGLVDELGGITAAKAYMKSLVSAKNPIRLVDMADDKGKSISIDFSSNLLLKLLGIPEFELINQEYKTLYEMWSDYQGEQLLMLSPLNGEDLIY